MDNENAVFNGYGAKISGIPLNRDKLFRTAAEIFPSVKTDSAGLSPDSEEILRLCDSYTYFSYCQNAILGEICEIIIADTDREKALFIKAVTDTEGDTYLLYIPNSNEEINGAIKNSIATEIRDAFSSVSDYADFLNFGNYTVEQDDNLFIQDQPDDNYFNPSPLYPAELLSAMKTGLFETERKNTSCRSVKNLTEEVIRRFVYMRLTEYTLPFDYPSEQIKALMLTPDPVSELSGMIYRRISASIFKQIENTVKDYIPKYLKAIEVKYNVYDGHIKKNNGRNPV